MSFQLTEKTKDLLERGIIEPNIVLTIDGINSFFGARIVKHYARYGEDNIYYGQPGLVYGGTIEIDGQRDIISLSGTSDSFSQQLDPDKGAVSSSGTIVIRLIDTGLEVTNLITPGSQGTNWDPLYKDAQVFVGLAESSYPDDYLELFNGKIMSLVPGPGYVDFTITHPEDLKRSDVFILAESKLTVDLAYYSLKLSDLIIQQLSDVEGIVSIQFISGGSGDVANVSVSGNTISVQIDITLTKAKTVKKKINNHEEANQLVYCSYNKAGDADNIQSLLSLQQLQISTELELESVKDFLAPLGTDLFKTYVKIGDEIIQYSGIDTVNNKLTGCERAKLDSVGVTHSIGDDVQSFYKLGNGLNDWGNGIDICLYLLLSGGSQYFATNVDAENFVKITTTETIDNAIFFKKQDVKRKYGLTIGDFVTSSGAINGANNFSLRKITGFGETELGTYLTVDGAALVFEVDSPAVLSFATKYNILPDGVGLTPMQVAVEEMEQVKSYYFASIANYEFYLKDTVSVKEFINEQILLPSAMYSVPRKGKISVKYTSAPLYDPNIALFSFDNVKNPSTLAPIRTVNRNFYNSILYKFNEDSLTDKLINGVATLSASSTNRIEAPNKTLKINAKGMRDNPDTRIILQRNANSLLKRYQFAAESFNLSVPLRVGLNVEVGDIVVFGGSEFQMTDITTGTRNFKERLFEVTNRNFNWKTGGLEFTIVDTNYSNDVRYATFSPTSKILSGTTTQVLVEDSYATLGILGAKEADKWRSLVGKDVMVHPPDWSVFYYSKLVEIDSGNPWLFKLDPPLASTPIAGWELDIAHYDNIDLDDGLVKSIHLFWDATLTIVTGISDVQFTVSALDAAKLFVGGLVQVHNEDYSIDSGTEFKKITSIAGVTITVEASLGFTPSPGQLVDAVGFTIDDGKPYVWL